MAEEWILDVRCGCLAIYRGPKRNCLSDAGNDPTVIHYRHGLQKNGVWEMDMQHVNDAILMAKSPELLRVLRNLVDRIGSGSNFSYEYSKAVELLAILPVVQPMGSESPETKAKPKPDYLERTNECESEK